MERIELQQLRDISLDELQKQADALIKRRSVLRYQMAQGKIKNVHELRMIRKNVARVLTLLHERLSSGIKDNL